MDHNTPEGPADAAPEAPEGFGSAAANIGYVVGPQARIDERYAKLRRGLEPIAARLATLPLMGSVRNWTLEFERKAFGTGYEEVDTVHGFRLYVEKTDHAVGRTLRATKTWQPEETKLIKRLCRPGDTCVDVGANIGYFANLMASIVGDKGTVLALEPDPTNFSHLERAAKYNGWTNLQAFQYAAGDQAGEVEFFSDPVNHGNHSIVKAGSHEGATTVKVVRLDDLIAEHAPDGQIRLIKIDVQGYESQVIEGLGKYVDRIDFMIVEYYPEVCEVDGGTAFLDRLASIGDLWIAQRGELVAASRDEVTAAVKKSPHAQVDLVVARASLEAAS